MTREEAIEYFESLLKRFEEMYETETSYWGKAHTETTIEATRLALTALRPVSREQVERIRGEWKPTESPYMNECEDCSVCGYRTPWGHGFRFCPACGAAQTDEAVEMVIARLEEMKNG